MPAIKLQERHGAAALWAGQCPAWDCRHRFEVTADPWQGKISVLSSLRNRLASTLRPAHQGHHVHGRFAVYEEPERGGE
jgi:hypothetical protein